MVLRMTGVALLASMMRAGREDEDRRPADPAWLLDGADAAQAGANQPS